MNLFKNSLNYKSYINYYFNLTKVVNNLNLNYFQFYKDFYEDFYAPDNTYIDYDLTKNNDNNYHENDYDDNNNDDNDNDDNEYDDNEYDDDDDLNKNNEEELFSYNSISIFDVPALNNDNRIMIWTDVDFNGEIVEHRENDLPAKITYYKENFEDIFDMKWSKKWYYYGKLHREGNPAVIYSDGTKIWYQNGLIHRDDGPAKIYATGQQEWYQEGKLHID